MSLEKKKSTTALGKVIAFDSWVGGVFNIERLVLAFKFCGLELLLIHVGSWGHDKNRKIEEHCGTLHVRDILYYKGLSFRDIIEHERPVAVLFLSTQAFAHQAFNRYCKGFGIPTLHLYHGIVCVQAATSNELGRPNISRYITLICSRIVKNCVHTGPVYIKALWQTKASLKDWLWFVNEIWCKIVGRYLIVAAPDTSTTACCVYTEADMQHAANRYRLPLKAVFSVGNPDLVRFGLSQEKIGEGLLRLHPRVNNVLYIETALFEAGMVFSSVNDYIRHILETKRSLDDQGFKLIVKLHPASCRTELPKLLQQSGVQLCSNEEFVVLLEMVSAVIVEPSSAALVPALYGLPLFLACYGKLSLQKYGEVLMTYPRARKLDAIDSFSILLESILQQTNLNETYAWINKNSGPMPAENMPQRVANVIMSLIEQKNIQERENMSVVRLESAI